MDKALKSIPVFSGEADGEVDVEEWLEDVITVKDHFKEDPQMPMWHRHVRKILSGKALEVVKLEPMKAPEDVIRRNFTKADQALKVVILLQGIKQDGTNIETFIGKIVSLKRRINPKVQDFEIVTEIIAKLDPIYYELLADKANSSLADFIVRAKEIEPVATWKKNQIPDRLKVEVDGSHTSMTTTTTTATIETNYVGTERKPYITTGITCHTCGGKGHVARQCPSNRGGRGRGRGRGNRGRGEINDRFQYNELMLTNNLYKETMILSDGKTYQALIDTGANISVISPVAIPRNNIIRPFKGQVTMANSEVKAVDSITSIEFSLNNNTYIHDFVVMPTSHHIILGTDFLIGKCDIKWQVATTEIDTTNIPEYIRSLYQKFLKVDSPSKLTPHTIRIKDQTPIYLKQYRYARPEKEFISTTIKQMLQKGVVRPSNSEYAFPVVLAPKGDSYRLCVNYKKLNDITSKIHYPLPRISDILEAAVKGKYFSKIDLKSGYWQIPVAEADKHKTAFICTDGHFEFNVMPFGLCNAASTFQRGINRVLENMNQFCTAYQDDILIWSDSEQMHLQHIRTVLERLLEYRLVPNWDKCQWSQAKIKYCGHLLSYNEIRVDKERADAISKIPYPSNIKELRAFLGMANYVRDNIPNYAQKVEPLLPLLRVEGNQKFCWKAEHSKAMDEVKRAIQNAQVINASGPGELHLYTDASATAAGYFLRRTHKGRKYNLGYGSKTFSVSERNYSVPKRELYAIYLACKHFRHLLVGNKVTIHTDHRSLTNLNLKNPTGIIVRWLDTIAEVSPEVIHIKGSENIVADALSRIHEIAAIELSNTDDIKECIEQHHGNLGGHYGVTKTYRLLRSKYKWPNMYKSIQQYVSECECQRFKPNNQDRRNPMKPITAEKPWQVIGVDIVGPHSLKNGEKKFFLIIVDYFSKWVEAIPLKDIKAGTVVSTIEEDFVWRREVPETIISDAGTQFTSSEFREWCKERNIRAAAAAPHHQQTNGQAEAMVKTLKTQLAIRLAQGDPWKTALKHASYHMNKYPNSTGFSPYYNIYGHSPNTAFDNSIIRRSEGLQEVERRTRTLNQEQKENMTHKYNNGKRNHVFTIGQSVWMINHYRKSWHEPRWIGPFQVIDRLDEDTYQLKDKHNNKYKVNVQHIKPSAVATNTEETREKVHDQIIPNATPTLTQQQTPMQFKEITNNNSSSPVKTPVTSPKTPSPSVGSSPMKSPSKGTQKKDLIGERVSVYWPDEQKHYKGTVVTKRRKAGSYEVQYDDEKRAGKGTIIEQLEGGEAEKWDFTDEPFESQTSENDSAETYPETDSSGSEYNLSDSEAEL
jgi:transposase InsO family protein